jgi:plasmid stabilization system protein ParE
MNSDELDTRINALEAFVVVLAAHTLRDAPAFIEELRTARALIPDLPPPAAAYHRELQAHLRRLADELEAATNAPGNR